MDRSICSDRLYSIGQCRVGRIWYGVEAVILTVGCCCCLWRGLLWPAEKNTCLSSSEITPLKCITRLMRRVLNGHQYRDGTLDLSIVSKCLYGPPYTVHHISRIHFRSRPFLLGRTTTALERSTYRTVEAHPLLATRLAASRHTSPAQPSPAQDPVVSSTLGDLFFRERLCLVISLCSRFRYSFN